MINVILDRITFNTKLDHESKFSESAGSIWHQAQPSLRPYDARRENSPHRAEGKYARSSASRDVINEYLPSNFSPASFFSSMTSTPTTTSKALRSSFIVLTSTVSGVTIQTVSKGTAWALEGECTSFNAAARARAPGR